MRPSGIKRADWYHYNVLFILEHVLGYNRFEKYFGKGRNGLYHKIDTYLNGTNRGTSQEVEQVDKSMSREEFIQQCYNPVLPKVFRGAANEWQAVKNWNLDFFEKNHGHKEILLNDNVGLTAQEFERMNLKYYINQIRSGSLKYLKFSDIVNEDENLKNDFDLAWLRKYKLPFSWGEDLKMFMGGKGTLTPLHIGFSSFLFVQVMGRKKWILYPANDRIFLDPRTERTFYFYSKANPYKKDDPAFLLLKHAKQYEVTLEPGDVLWVPSFTWHHVENPTDSIGIRYGRSSIPGSARSSKLMTALIFMATKPNIFMHFYTSRKQKQEYTFIKSQAEIEKSILDKLKTSES
jgi:histone arginine demethylase JMJD6